MNPGLRGGEPGSQLGQGHPKFLSGTASLSYPRGSSGLVSVSPAALKALITS